MANRCLSCIVGLRRAYVVWGEQMGLTGSGWMGPPGRTVHVKGYRALALGGSRRSVTIPQPPYLSTPITHFSELVVLAGWRAVGIKNMRLAACQTVSGPLGRGCCVISICRIPALTDAQVVYCLARESTGIDVSDYANARSAR